MSAQHSFLESLRLGFEAFLSSLRADDAPTSEAAPPAQTTPVRYPIAPSGPGRPGSKIREWSKTHPSQPLHMTAATRLSELSPEQLRQIAYGMSPKALADVPTVRVLSPDDLSEEVVQKLDVLKMHRRPSAPRLEAIPPEQVSRPLWLDLLSQPQEIGWLTEDPPPQPKRPSGFLLSSEEVVLSEEELRPSLEDDPDATEMRPIVRKE